MATVQVVGDERGAAQQGVPLVLQERPLSSMVWELAWPAVVVNLIQSVNMFVDSSFIGRLGTSALAGAGLFSSIAWMMLALAIAVGTASTALVARFYGAQDLEQARKAMHQCISITVVAAVLACGMTLLLMHPLLDALMGDRGPDAKLNAIRLLLPALAGIPAVFLTNVLVGSLRAIGDTRSPILVMSVMMVVHLGTSYVLIFGHLGFAPMGIAGAGIGFALSSWVGTLLFLPILARRDLGRVHLPRLPEWSWVKRVVRLGYPNALQSESRVLGMMVFMGILARTIEGEIAVATLRIGLVVESIAFMPGLGYAIAASALVGQSLGAKMPDRGGRIAWIAGLQACIAMCALALVFVLFARPFGSIFVDDVAVINLTVSYLYIAALSYPFLAYFIVMGLALQGAGDTLRSALVAITSMWIFRLPLGYVMALVLGMGANGAWWAMTIATVAGGLMAVYIFWRGNWKLVTV
jgi:putative MATE family efflux protein